MPDFRLYHESITSELEAVKNRIGNLVNHRLTVGEWKEAALRTVLRRHLPEASLLGRGFIVSRESCSTQIDLLVLKLGKPKLFRDGDLVVVTPDVPAAIVEVKTCLEGPAAWQKVVRKLARHGSLCQRIAGDVPWLGIFTYEGNVDQANNILNAASEVHRATGIAINGVSCGNELFVRYWPAGHREAGDIVEDSVWRAYRLQRLAPSYFVSNLVDAISNLDRAETDYVWFAHQEGKRPYMIAETRAHRMPQ